ncbi:hypothetical protein XELAEV_18008394mg [Xenopus laevis]|uniref:Uncharacterized protein n=1 Tax=Xenopus laevis TaxID=8355 RepID=A0A974E2J0_XENLA|nr:hypothetical protein XELAEV_18008394mg [Xenopus laevis]
MRGMRGEAAFCRFAMHRDNFGYCALFALYGTHVQAYPCIPMYSLLLTGANTMLASLPDCNCAAGGAYFHSLATSTLPAWRGWCKMKVDWLGKGASPDMHQLTHRRQRDARFSSGQ